MTDKEARFSRFFFWRGYTYQQHFLHRNGRRLRHGDCCLLANSKAKLATDFRSPWHLKLLNFSVSLSLAIVFLFSSLSLSVSLSLSFSRSFLSSLSLFFSITNLFFLVVRDFYLRRENPTRGIKETLGLSPALPGDEKKEWLNTWLLLFTQLRARQWKKFFLFNFLLLNFLLFSSFCFLGKSERVSRVEITILKQQKNAPQSSISASPVLFLHIFALAASYLGFVKCCTFPNVNSKTSKF